MTHPKVPTYDTLVAENPILCRDKLHVSNSKLCLFHHPMQLSGGDNFEGRVARGLQKEERRHWYEGLMLEGHHVL